MNRHKKIIIIIVVAVCVLALAGMLDKTLYKAPLPSAVLTEDILSPAPETEEYLSSETAEDVSLEIVEDAPPPVEDNSVAAANQSAALSPRVENMEDGTESAKDQYLTTPVPEGNPTPVEPQNVTVSNGEYSCTLSVRCDTLLDKMNLLDKEKWELVPTDGVIFPAATVTFYEGESVFNVLQREMKRAKIHLEFVNTPIYNSAYIEGLNNLYEFDAGELSGWMYKVNDWYPNYGSSRYQLKDGDVVEWRYTCDLGRDLGEYWIKGKQKDE
ncbi:MAG: DUF4430 domain-containing protein [Clostridiales bacterium]|jgi:hypothetical protein|nr:DUF4430 domain-containing protein [Clostridiales bacterium]